MDKKPYYISTAIAYTSAKPHIGNTYEIVLISACPAMRSSGIFGICTCARMCAAIRPEASGSTYKAAPSLFDGSPPVLKVQRDFLM